MNHAESISSGGVTAPRRLLVTGTDTGVGKTYVSCMIVRQLLEAGHRTGVCKPACSGAETRMDGSLFWADIEQLQAAAGGMWTAEQICPQRFLRPLAPPVAARAEGRQVDAALLRTAVRQWNGLVDQLIVEGVGGLLCPLTEDETVADLAVDLQLPLLVVARAGLGTIGHTLLTLEVARGRGLNVVGVILNEESPAEDLEAGVTNLNEIAARTTVPVLGLLRHGDSHGLLHCGQIGRMNWPSLLAAGDSDVPSL